MGWGKDNEDGVGVMRMGRGGSEDGVGVVKMGGGGGG